MNIREGSWKSSLLLGFVVLSVCFQHGYADVVKVKSPQELINLFKSGSTVNDTVQLASDLDFSGSSHTLPLGAFSNGTCVAFTGVFEGNGHSIKNLKMNNKYNAGYSNAGLFCSLKNATIDNIVIDSSCSFIGYYAGALSVSVNGSLIVKRTTNNAAVSGTQRVGGFIGFVEELEEPTLISFEDCVNHGTIIGISGSVGGFVGYIKKNINMTLTVSDSSNNAIITAASYAGGFVGEVASNTYMTITISSFINDGIITGSDGFIGGFVGNMEENINLTMIIDSSHNNGFANGDSRIGGFVGDIFRNTNTTMIISNSTNNGMITGNSYAGGLFGRINSMSTTSVSNSISFSITNSANKGSVLVKQGMACGFICVDTRFNYKVNITIKNSVNKGDVNAATDAYGFANIITAARNVVSMGDVTGSSGSSFWGESTDVGLFYGVKNKCTLCSDATLFQHNTNTGFYEVTGSGEHVDDLLNGEEAKQHFCMVWTKELELVHSGREDCKILSAAILNALSPIAFIAVFLTLFIGF